MNDILMSLVLQHMTREYRKQVPENQHISVYLGRSDTMDFKLHERFRDLIDPIALNKSG